MLKSFITFTLRLIKRDKFHSLLNIIGLSAGIACSIIILLYLQNQLTYDKHHEKADRIYRISSNYVTSGKPTKFALSSPALGKKLKDEYPEIDDFVRITPIPEILFRSGEKTFYEKKIAFVDPSIFRIFTHQFIYGDPDDCLKDPRSTVLTERLARKYFGDLNPLGKEVQVENNSLLKVTGVIEDLPQNSHLRLDGFISYSTIDPKQERLNLPIFEIEAYTYILVNENFSQEIFREKFPAFYKKHAAEDAKIYGQVFEPILQKLSDIHFGPQMRADFPRGNIAYIYAFFSIGIFILVLACINYMNMATARSAYRAKEIGMKKILGLGKKNLVLQILSESMLFSLAALILAFGLVEFIIEFTPLGQILDINLKLDLLANPLFLFGSLFLCIFVGLFSGLYPAFYLSAILPVSAITDTFTSGKKGLYIRRLLVTSQFVISIGVVIVTLFMNDQIDFMQNRELGFKKENVVSIPIKDESVIKKIPALKEELLRHKDIISVTTGNGRPGITGTGLYWFEGKDGLEESNFYVLQTDYNYLDVLGIELVRGRDFNKTYPSDRNKAVIVNETLAKRMGWDNPIGKKIIQKQAKLPDFEAEVIGVVKDFNFYSLHNEIEPLLIRMQETSAGSLMIRLKGDSIVETMGFLEERWKDINPNRPFIYSFLDDEFDRFYDADRQQNRLFKIFTYICILISCLGLLGLSSFNATRRTKEIAIRKVHGASAVRIVIILFKEVFYLVVFASVIAIPISVILINKWLENFAYGTGINIMIFILTTAAGMIIAFLTASYNCIKIASKNPVESLKYE